MADESLALELKRRKGREKMARWRANNPEAAAEIDRQQRIKHSKKRAAQTVAWREANADRVREYQTEYEAGRRDKRAAEKREGYAANPEPARDATRQWRRDNPGKMLLQKHRRRARQYGAEGSYTEQEAMALLENQGHLCANPYCRIDLTISNRALDHKRALARGGTNWIANMQWLCQPCNSRKTTLDIEVWLAREADRVLSQGEI